MYVFYVKSRLASPGVSTGKIGAELDLAGRNKEMGNSFVGFDIRKITGNDFRTCIDLISLLGKVTFNKGLKHRG
jgi:hypothetical protein